MPAPAKNILHYLFLYPLSLLYGFVVGFRNTLFNLTILKSVSFDTPVISIGNITVGGTGKTPHVEYLLKLLSGTCKTAMLSRGYKRKTNGYVCAGKTSNVKKIGDEPLQVARKFPNVIVAVDEKRANGIQQLISSYPDLKAIILDDAYQHRYVKPGLSILLIDYQRPISKDHLLPFGRLRESAFEKKRANIIIITKTPDQVKPIDKRMHIKQLKLFPYQSVFFTRITYGKVLLPVFPETINTPITIDATKKQFPHILVVSGIANPSPLIQFLRKHSSDITLISFPDHHQFNQDDMSRIQKKIQNDSLVITTEKDAVRLTETTVTNDMKNKLYYLPISIEFLDNQGKVFNKMIEQYVKNKKKKKVLA
jgi:tetraacyldisaccharide 4'-kinase